MIVDERGVRVAPGTIPARTSESDAEADRDLMAAVSRAAVERFYRAYLTGRLRTPLCQIQKRVAKIERLAGRFAR